MEDFTFQMLFSELQVQAFLRVHPEVFYSPDATEVDPYSDLLLWYLDETLRALEPLRAYGDAQARHWRKRNTGWAYEYQHQRNLWDLYALSRVSDLLLAPFTPVGDTAQFSPFHETWEPLLLRVEERTAWFLSLGMRRIEAAAFYPFYHEIVAVEQSPDPGEPITLVETIWPGFMLGQMLFCRAGVKVCGGSRHIVKPIAETSTLYFAYRRNNRPTCDLSHGWGSNSQWGTDFRRDYEDSTTFFYNVDGGRLVDAQELHPHDTNMPPNARLTPEDRIELINAHFTPEERIELLTHRCFIVTDKPQDDLWPFDDTYEEAKHGQ